VGFLDDLDDIFWVVGDAQQGQLAGADVARLEHGVLQEFEQRRPARLERLLGRRVYLSTIFM
jgi:hypothetical protein